MNQPIFLTSSQIRQWGERTMPLVKRQAYVFSLDLRFRMDHTRVGRVRNDVYVAVQSGPAKSPPEGFGETYHVQDEVLVKTVDGVVRDVPSGKVIRSNEWLFVNDAGAGSVEGRVLLSLDADAYVSVAFTGVISLTGETLLVLTQGPRILAQTKKLDVHGSTQISLRSQCEKPKYRWLVENQLFGFGRMHLSNGEYDQPTGNWKCEALFSYDVYSMGGGGA